MFAVTGATGRLGAMVVDRLLERVPASRVAVSVRDLSRAGALAARGVRVRPGDYDDPDALRGALEGVTDLLLISSNSGGPRIADQHRTAIAVAAEAGVRRVVYTAHQNLTPGSAFAPATSHQTTMDALAASDLSWVALRNGYYASTLEWLAAEAPRTGELATPADGPVSWTAHPDLADAAARVLLGQGGFEGSTPPLTAARTWTLAQVAEELSGVVGRPIRRVVVDDDEFVRRTVAAGRPEPMARFQLGMFQAIRAGEFDVVDPALGALIGRPTEGILPTLEAIAAVA